MRKGIDRCDARSVEADHFEHDVRCELLEDHTGPHIGKLTTGEGVQFTRTMSELPPAESEQTAHAWAQVMPPKGAIVYIVADADGVQDRFELDAVIYGDDEPLAIRVHQGALFLVIPWRAIRSLGWAK